MPDDWDLKELPVSKEEPGDWSKLLAITVLHELCEMWLSKNETRARAYLSAAVLLGDADLDADPWWTLGGEWRGQVVRDLRDARARLKTRWGWHEVRRVPESVLRALEVRPDV